MGQTGSIEAFAGPTPASPEPKSFASKSYTLRLRLLCTVRGVIGRKSRAEARQSHLSSEAEVAPCARRAKPGMSARPPRTRWTQEEPGQNCLKGLTKKNGEPWWDRT